MLNADSSRKRYGGLGANNSQESVGNNYSNNYVLAASTWPGLQEVVSNDSDIKNENQVDENDDKDADGY